jgi:hypothetical protein
VLSSALCVAFAARRGLERLCWPLGPARGALAWLPFGGMTGLIGLLADRPEADCCPVHANCQTVIDERS